MQEIERLCLDRALVILELKIPCVNGLIGCVPSGSWYHRTVPCASVGRTLMERAQVQYGGNAAQTIVQSYAVVSAVGLRPISIERTHWVEHEPHGRGRRISINS